MKFIWEESDLKRTDINGILAEKDSEIVIVNAKGCTSLRDGLRWMKQSNPTEIVEYLNKYEYSPVIEYINACDLIKSRKKKT